MKEIKLSDNIHSMLCDDEDYEMLSQINWCYGTAGYAFKSQWKQETLFAHKIVMNAPQGQMVDHKDRNKLNNQKDNLRFATDAQNQMNRLIDSRNSTGYKGVHWSNSKQRYVARVGLNNKHVECGQFKSPHDAALAYNKKALELHGEFAVLNSIDETINTIAPIPPRKKSLGSVTYHKRDGKYRVSYRGKWVGQCKTISEAEHKLLTYKTSLTE